MYKCIISKCTYQMSGTCQNLQKSPWDHCPSRGKKKKKERKPPQKSKNHNTAWYALIEKSEYGAWWMEKLHLVWSSKEVSRTRKHLSWVWQDEPEELARWRDSWGPGEMDRQREVCAQELVCLGNGEVVLLPESRIHVGNHEGCF